VVHPLQILTPPSGLKIFLHGPDISQGPLPALFYFALSGKDSLMLPPYNQPAEELAHDSIRIFSFDLPYHGEGHDPKYAIKEWMHAFQNNPQFLNEFISKVYDNLTFLIQEGWVNPDKIAVAGLSRGGLFAVRLAALEPRIKTILGYAPVTSFEHLSEFHTIESIPEAQFIKLETVIDQLIDKRLRFYVGNRDQRVNTDACYHFIRKLTDRTFELGRRIAEVELIISPSVGYKGHGTVPSVFKDGIDWIKRTLLLS
jgi:dienelactone hydrolase